jgi:hypothetical protein
LSHISPLVNRKSSRLQSDPSTDPSLAHNGCVFILDRKGPE